MERRMRFGEKRENRIKITSVTYFDVRTQTIFFDVLTEKNGEEKFFKDLFINLSQPKSGRAVSSDRKFSLRVNNYITDLRLLEVKIFSIRSPKKIDQEGIYWVSLDF